MSSISREEEWQLAIQAIETVIAHLKSDNREPDRWEREALAEAIGALFRGAYRLAAVNAQTAKVPKNERSLTVPLDTAYDDFDLQTLDKAFTLAREQGILPHAILGPISVEFTNGDQPGVRLRNGPPRA